MPSRPSGLPLVTATPDEGDMALAIVHTAFLYDFRDSWDSVAANPRARGRGNFMYAFMATNYLEWAATIARQDSAVAKRFATALGQRDKHYFRKLPVAWRARPPQWFPATASGLQDHALWAVFDLVRNGLAHRYQQIDAQLPDGRFRVQIVGAEHQVFRDGQRRPPTHFRPFEVARPPAPSYLIVRLFPDVLYADIDHAVISSGLLALTPTKFRRPYPVTIARLRKAIGVRKGRGPL